LPSSKEAAKGGGKQPRATQTANPFLEEEGQLVFDLNRSAVRQHFDGRYFQNRRGVLMKYVELEFKNLKVYLPADATLGDLTGKEIRPTSTGKKIEKVKAALEEFVLAVAGSLHDKLSKLPALQSPNQIELSFSVGFSAELDAWVIGGKAEQGIELKLIWSAPGKNGG
jgi:hypothetical protein